MLCFVLFLFLFFLFLIFVFVCFAFLFFFVCYFFTWCFVSTLYLYIRASNAKVFCDILLNCLPLYGILYYFYSMLNLWIVLLKTNKESVWWNLKYIRNNASYIIYHIKITTYIFDYFSTNNQKQIEQELTHHIFWIIYFKKLQWTNKFCRSLYFISWSHILTIYFYVKFVILKLSLICVFF